MKVLYQILIFLLFIPGCGAKKVSNGDVLKISVSHYYIYAWYNLMPGSPSSFHITGNLRIQNVSNSVVNDLSLKEVIILQDDNSILKFKPGFETIHEGEDFSLKKNEVKEFRFGAQSGLSTLTALNMDEKIDARLIFSSEGKFFEYSIIDILVEKTY